MFSVYQHPASQGMALPTKARALLQTEDGRTPLPPLHRLPMQNRHCCASPGPTGKRRRVLSAAPKALLPEPLSLVREHPCCYSEGALMLLQVSDQCGQRRNHTSSQRSSSSAAHCPPHSSFIHPDATHKRSYCKQVTYKCLKQKPEHKTSIPDGAPRGGIRKSKQKPTKG